jgi:hypothetical protein
MCSLRVSPPPPKEKCWVRTWSGASVRGKHVHEGDFEHTVPIGSSVNFVDLINLRNTSLQLLNKFLTRCR